jgi:catechol 2,3-dioxygenase-like lactoylglutathione lyase family enzyme
MTDQESKFVNLSPVFVSHDIQKTVKYYTEVLGFASAKHYDKIENFATLYRDEIEFIIVQAKKGEVRSNRQRYGEGFDAYIDTAAVEGIDAIYHEYKDKGVKILVPPHRTEYGSWEFVFEDIDSREIGVGRIMEKETYFKDSNVKID